MNDLKQEKYDLFLDEVNQKVKDYNFDDETLVNLYYTYIDSDFKIKLTKVNALINQGYLTEAKLELDELEKETYLSCYIRDINRNKMLIRTKEILKK